MASNHNLYISHFKGNVTHKLSYYGYSYTRNKVYHGKKGESWHFQCDQRKTCKATYIRNPDLTWKQGSHWEKNVHATHQPNFDRTEAEMIRGRLKHLAKEHPKLPAEHISSIGLKYASVSAQVIK